MKWSEWQGDEFFMGCLLLCHTRVGGENKKERGFIMDKNKLIGKRIKEARKEKGYSLEDVGYILKDKYKIEIDNSNISRYEAGGVKNMNPVILKGLCKIVGLDYIEIFRELDFIDEIGNSHLDNKIKNLEEENKKLKEKYAQIDDRVLGLDKRSFNQYEKTMNEASLFFQDENVSDEDKQKLMLAINEMFFRSKEINKKKYAHKKKDEK